MERAFDDTVYYEPTLLVGRASAKAEVRVVDLCEMRSIDIMFKGRSEVVWMI